MTVIWTDMPTDGGLSGSDNDLRHREILDQLYRLYPEEKALLVELDNLFGYLWSEAEEEGARRQCLLIRAAIDGDLRLGEDGIHGTVEL